MGKLSFSECLKDKDESWKFYYLGALYDLNPERQYKYLWMLSEYEKLTDSSKSDFQFSVLCTWIYRHTHLDLLKDFRQHRLTEQANKRNINSKCVLVMGEETFTWPRLCKIGNTKAERMNGGMRPPVNMRFSEWLSSKDDAWKIRNLGELHKLNSETQRRYLNDLADLTQRVRSYEPTDEFEDQFLDVAIQVFMEMVWRTYTKEWNAEFHKLLYTPTNVVSS